MAAPLARWESIMRFVVLVQPVATNCGGSLECVLSAGRFLFFFASFLPMVNLEAPTILLLEARSTP